MIKQHFESVPPLDPLHLIILGEGGTGKSYLINAIRNLLAHHCLITAPTGKAAFNIKGVTLHSLFKLPIGSKWQKELSGQSLIDLQHNLNDVQYILIDEFSYVGQTMLGWINKRCKQATGCQEEILGNLSFILIGDPAQLPPVADKPLYHSIPSNDIGEEGYLIYHMFHTVIQLTENHRVAGNNSKQHRFRELLKRLRTGDSTEDDWHLLLTRQPSKIPDMDRFSDAVRLFFSNEDVAKYNSDRLDELGEPVACINARHSPDAAKKIDADLFNGLEPSIFLAKGANVMLTLNLWTSVGLCNGICGIVKHIIYQVNQSPPNLPIGVMIEFPDYTGPPMMQESPKLVPICPVTASFNNLGTTYERQQLPLRLAWAITIHKSQGLTLELAWIDIGNTERVPGLKYVAISRVRSLDSCVIQPMSFERLQAIKKCKNLQYRIAEEVRLQQLSL